MQQRALPRKQYDRSNSLQSQSEVGAQHKEHRRLQNCKRPQPTPAMATLLDARPAGTPPGKRALGVVSPDKTEASTPPHSPDRATDESAMYSNTPAVAARHGIKSGGLGGGGLAAVDEGLPSPPPAGSPSNDLAAAGAGATKKGKKAPLLGVNRILCRAPSNESNISDLSASLSPGGPRGASDPFPKGPASQRSEGEHILASLLNDCGVLPAVTDLLEEAGLGSAAGGAGGAHALPAVSPSASEGAVSGVSAASKSAPKYETPAVWGVAPDDDGSAAPATPGTGGSKASPGARSGNHAREDSVEYDNVELVLDEAVAPAPELAKAESTPSTKGFGLSKLRRPSSLPKQASNSEDGRKSPAGMLKLRSKRSKTPSPANAPETTLGAAVVESKNDPRISHTYDIAHFDNEELRPSVGEGARGATPASVPSAGSRVATPVSPLAMESPSRTAGVADPGTPSRVELALASGAVKNDEREAKKKGLLKGLRIKPKRGHRRSTSVPQLGTEYRTPTRASATAKDDTALITPTASPKPTQAQIEEAMRWKATADKTSGKAYYYHRDTKEVRWDKPPGFDEAMVIKKIRDGAAGSPATVPTAPSGKGPKAQSGKKVADAGASKGEKAKSKRGFGLGRSKAKAAEKEAAAAAANAKAAKAAKDLADKNREMSKYWRATTDPSTGKTYYYNKKTKEVSWSKPAGYEEKGGKKEAAKETVKETAAMTSVADKRKKGAWFKQGSSSDKSDKGDGDGAVVEEKESKEDAALAEAKHWRAAQDPGTGKVYYFNKKTKLVQWTKPECFEWKEKMARQEKTAAAAEGAKEEAKVEAGAEAEAETAGEDAAQEEDQSEIEAFSDDEAVDKPAVPVVSAEDAPFDEPDAPFDEPFDELASPKQPLCYTADPLPSPKRAHFGPSSPRDDNSGDDSEEEEEERQDSFDEADKAPPVASEPLYGRVKSLASINFNGRSRTFASQMTDTTKKAGNRGSGGAADANGLPARIASEIAVAPPPEPVTVARRLRERELPPPPKRSSHPRAYGGKKAEHLGDSSIESIEEESRAEAQREEWTDDDVSALSGIGNESLEGKQKRRARATKAGARQEARPERAPATESVKEWTQEELDSFIAKNDWQSVSKYINEMRVAKGPRDRLADKEPSIREIREHLARDRRDASPPKAAFGARSQLQHDGQASEESESVWQSLSSASYEEGSEGESSYDRRRSAGRRRSSPRERMM
ncbi:hypothetical protein ACHAXT_011872 [Thalassiosira profunda]